MTATGDTLSHEQGEKVGLILLLPGEGRRLVCAFALTQIPRTGTCSCPRGGTASLPCYSLQLYWYHLSDVHRLPEGRSVFKRNSLLASFF